MPDRAARSRVPLPGSGDLAPSTGGRDDLFDPPDIRIRSWQHTVVGRDRVHDLEREVVALGDLGPDPGVAALDLVVDGLADVVQEPGPPCDGAVESELVGDHLCKERDFDGVAQHILAVAGSEVHLAQRLDDLRMDAANIGLHDRLVADLDDALLDVALGLLDEFLDAGWVDAAVGHETLQRFARGYSPNVFVAGGDVNNDGLDDIVTGAGAGYGTTTPTVTVTPVVTGAVPLRVRGGLDLTTAQFTYSNLNTGTSPHTVTLAAGASTEVVLVVEFLEFLVH